MGAARDPFEQQAVSSSPEKKEERNNLARLIPIGRAKKFARVPTHAVGFARERRRNPRAILSLPMRLICIAQVEESLSISLVAQNISSSGVYFLSPRKIESGTAIELEVGLVDRPLGCGSVLMRTAAHVVRSEPAATAGWHGVAATFDDFDFQRDDHIPRRFE